MLPRLAAYLRMLIRALFLMTGVIALQPLQEARAPNDVRDAAIDAAKWIRSARIKTPHGTVWPVDPASGKPIETNLYAGTPGVVLFFLELHHATGRRDYLDEAVSGADHLLSVIDATQDAGLYTGLSGIGFTLGEAFRATKDPKYVAGERKVLARLSATAKSVGVGAEWSNVNDIIGGSAGIGLFLLHAARTLPSDDALVLARRAGRRLLEVGIAEQGGTKWQMSPGFARLMPNFSHGTAGIAYFLAALYHATKDQAFLDGALSGARYLKSIAKTDGDICLVFHHEPEEEGKNLFYLSWCHGPAGTARLWYELYKVTKDREWLAWAERSARAVMTSGIPEKQTPGFWNNVSQCCGSAGVAAFALSMHEVTHKQEYLEFSRRVTRDLLSRATRDTSGTRWVQAENRVQPDLVIAQTGWMQGAAGMGAWLLRLDAFERGRKPLITLPDNPF